VQQSRSPHVCRAGSPTSTSAGPTTRPVHDPRERCTRRLRLLSRRHPQAAAPRSRRASVSVCLRLSRPSARARQWSPVSPATISPPRGASGFAATIAAVREVTLATPCRGSHPRLQGFDCGARRDFAARPRRVCTINLETVARLHRAARPSRAYARSRALLREPRDVRFSVTKVVIILGMGEDDDEVPVRSPTCARLSSKCSRSGQYSALSRQHLPVARWLTPDEFAALGGVRCRGSGPPRSRRDRSSARATTPGGPPRSFWRQPSRTKRRA